MDRLPNEILEKILLYLPPSDRLDSALTCHRWAQVSSGPSMLKDIKLIARDADANAEILRRSRRPYVDATVVRKDESVVCVRDFWVNLGPSLRRLRLLVHKLSCVELSHVLSHCPRLESLEISANNLYTIRNHSKIRELGEIRGWNNIRDITFSARPSPESKEFIVHCLGLMPNITSFSLISTAPGNFDLQDSVLRLNRGFVKLDFSGWNIVDRDIKRVVELYSSSLRELRLDSCFSLTREAFEAIAICSELRLFCIRFAGINDWDLQRICLNNPHLEHLQMTGCTLITNHGLKYLPTLKCLRHLSPPRCHQFNVDILSELPRISTLRHLSLSNSEGDMEDFRKLAFLKSLRSLGLHCDEATIFECLRVISESFKELDRLELWCSSTNDSSAHDGVRRRRRRSGASLPTAFEDPSLPRLRSLRLSGEFTDACLAVLARSVPNIEALSLIMCDDISDAGLESLVRCTPGLRKLELGFSAKLTARSFQILYDLCPVLRTIRLWDNPVRKQAVFFFKGQARFVRVI